MWQQKYDFLYILLFVCLSFFSMQKHKDINNAYTCNSPTNWLHLQVNWTLSWWMNLNPRCISPCRFPTEPPFSRRTPLPCSGFHRPAPRPFSVQRLVSQKTHGQKACEKKEPCDGFISYLLEVYIYIFYKNVPLLINGRGRSGFAVHSLQGHWKQACICIRIS